MKIVILFLVLFGFYKPGFTQEKKIMSEEGIKTQVIWVAEKHRLKKVKYKKQEIRFDRDGNRIEEVLFNYQGDIIYHSYFEYDKNKLVREILLDKKGYIITRTDYRYNGKLLVEKNLYDRYGISVKNLQYIYEKQD